MGLPVGSTTNTGRLAIRARTSIMQPPAVCTERQIKTLSVFSMPMAFMVCCALYSIRLRFHLMAFGSPVEPDVCMVNSCSPFIQRAAKSTALCWLGVNLRPAGRVKSCSWLYGKVKSANWKKDTFFLNFGPLIYSGEQGICIFKGIINMERCAV